MPLRDIMQANPGTISGTPTLISSMLVRSLGPALRFSGGSSFTVPHTSNLTLLNGAVGGVAFVFPLRIPAYPLAEAYLFNKSGEYGASILPDGTLRFHLTGGTVDSSAPIPLNTGVFVELVYNGSYSGDPVVGNNTQGSAQEGMAADYMAGSTTGENNLQVCRFQMLERGLITQLNLDLQRYDNNPAFQDVAAVAYADSAAAPAAKLAQTAGQLLGSTALGTQPRVWQPFTVDEPFILDIGDFLWLGYAGGARHTSESPVMLIGKETSGGTRKGRNSVVSASSAGPASQSVADPFGAAALSDAVKLAVYADYSPLGRDGNEGNLLIYLDGQEDARAAYTAGITPGTNDLTGPEFTVDMDDLLLFDRRLTAVECAQLYAAR